MRWRCRQLDCVSDLGHVLACALALTVVGTASANAAPRTSPTVACSPGGGRTIARSHHVRVFARRGKFYSCWLPTRLRTTLGRLGEPIPNQAATLATHVRIDGQYVAFATQQTGDPGFSLSRVVSVNARTGRVAREVEPSETESFSSFVEDVGVAADGALVYMQADGTPCPGERTLKDGERRPDDALIAVEPGVKRHTLDCETPSDPAGSISKLEVVGQTATWMHAGVLHTAPLR